MIEALLLWLWNALWNTLTVMVFIIVGYVLLIIVLLVHTLRHPPEEHEKNIIEAYGYGWTTFPDTEEKYLEWERNHR